MRNFAEFKGHICTANPDGSIPINSKVACSIYGRDEPLLRDLIAQANLAYDMRQAMSLDNTQSPQFKEAFERYAKVTDVVF